MADAGIPISIHFLQPVGSENSCRRSPNAHVAITVAQQFVLKHGEVRIRLALTGDVEPLDENDAVESTRLLWIPRQNPDLVWCKRRTTESRPE
jgi:hypothetical protein